MLISLLISIKEITFLTKLSGYDEILKIKYNLFTTVHLKPSLWKVHEDT